MITLEPIPIWQVYVFGALGAIVLWIKMNKANKKVHALGDLLEDLLPHHPRVAKLLQFVVFVALGTVIGKIAVDPYTQLQAFAGGVAWSRLAAKD
jgi:Na+/H+-dicarboxylate symporter